MSITVLVGAQWGDEGKGKITDYLAENSDIVARYQGGNNAGHTVVIGNQKIFLHLLPSGVLRPHTISIIGGGVVIDPEALIKEMEAIVNIGYNITNRLFIDYKAHIIFPYHKILDKAKESGARTKIGTTGKGIGPAYEDKYARIGIRMGDILEEEYFMEKLEEVLTQKNIILEKIYNQKGINIEELRDAFKGYRKVLIPYIEDTGKIIYESKEEKEEKGRDYYKRESGERYFKRIVSLPREVEGEKAKAEYANGVLKIEIPKKTPKKEREKKIKIKVKKK